MNMVNKFSFGFRQLNFNDRDDSLFYSYMVNDIILCIFSIIICIFGLVGNGIFLWLLAFNIKRNVFTTYLLNFSLASLGLLSVIVFMFVYLFLSNIGVHINTHYAGNLIPLLLLMTWHSSQFILSIISIDRCVFVLYPSWYLRHKLPNFPIFLCFLIWGFSFLMSGILFILSSKRLGPYYEMHMCWLWGPFFLCFLVVTVSTLTLFIKACLKSPQQRGALTVAILLTLLLFLLLDVFVIITVFIVNNYNSIWWFLSGCSLVSTLNPLIYFLVGRWKGSQVQASMRVILQRVFKEEEPPPASHTQLQSYC